MIIFTTKEHLWLVRVGRKEAVSLIFISTFL